MEEKYPKLQDKCFSYFKDRIYENGVETLKLSSWEDFHKVVEIFNEYKDYYIWRGQRCYSEQLEDAKSKEKCKLISTFDRDKKFSKKKDRKKELNKVLDNFKNTNNIDDFSTENEIWAFKQHYGLRYQPLFLTGLQILI